LAVPALAFVEPDPIFAALREYEAAVAIENAGYDARSDADDAFRAKYGGYHPSGLAKGALENEEGRMQRFWLRGHSGISKLKKRIPAETLAEMHRELNRQTDDYELTVLPVHDAVDAAFEKRYAAQMAVFDTAPTTLAGIRAKIDFAFSADYVTESLTGDGNNNNLRSFLETLY
jgi:hypothetical protein